MSKFEIEGLKELEQQLLALGDAMASQKALQSALRSAAKPMFDAAKAKAPVAPGTYTRHISDEKGSTKKEYQPGHVGKMIVMRKNHDKRSANEAAGIVITVKRGGWWGRFFEHGSPTVPRSPFMLPAFDENHTKTLADFSGQLQKAIARVIRRRSKK